MIELDSTRYSPAWGLIGVVLAAGWAAFAILGPESNAFLAVMVVSTILLAGGAAVLLRRWRA